MTPPSSCSPTCSATPGAAYPPGCCASRRPTGNKALQPTCNAQFLTLETIMTTTPTGAAIPRDPTEAIIDTILRREGWPRYTNRPSDRGGPTKGGITLATLASWRKRPVTATDVAALDEAEVRAIYRARYIEEPGFAGKKIAPAGGGFRQALFARLALEEEGRQSSTAREEEMPPNGRIADPRRVGGRVPKVLYRIRDILYDGG